MPAQNHDPKVPLDVTYMYSITLLSLLCSFFLTSRFQHLLIISPHHIPYDILSNFCKMGCTFVSSDFFSPWLYFHCTLSVIVGSFFIAGLLCQLESAENFSSSKLSLTKICSAENRMSCSVPLGSQSLCTTPLQKYPICDS